MHNPSTDALRPALAKFMVAPSYRVAKRLERKLAKLDDNCTVDLFSRRIKIALGGNCNTDFIRPAMIAAFAGNGFHVECTSLDHDGWVSAALQGKAKVDWWVVWLSALGASRGGTERREFDTQGVKAAAASIAARGEGLLVILPEALHWEDDPFSPFARWRHELLDVIDSSLPPTTVRLSVDHLQRRHGRSPWHASRYWTLGKCACHPDAAAAVGVAAAEALSLAVRPVVKAVITDLDNTLWGGVVGDDGPENLRLDPDDEGRPFVEMQRFLKDLSLAGVPICVASKNEPEQARRPFNERAEMVLELSDIVYFHASWSRKHEAIRKIADDLNLGIENICFLDDSLHERHEARSFLPNLIVPDLCDDPEARVPELLRSGLFSVPILREEDQRRTQMYREEVERQQAVAEAVDYETYLKSLRMELKVDLISQKNLPRVTSLVLKTIQFNVTNKRSSAKMITTLSDDPDGYAFCGTLKDRFGDAGIICVLLARLSNSKVYIEEWVLSCRVFGRGVEDGMFSHLTGWMNEQGYSSVEVGYCPTDQNKMIVGKLEQLGFTQNGGSGEISRWESRNVFAPRHFIKIES